MLHPAKAKNRHSQTVARAIDEPVMRRVLAAAADLTLIIDEKGVIESTALGEVFKEDPAWSNLVGQRWSDTVAKDSRVKVERLLEEARAEQLPRSREINQQTSLATEVPFLFSATRLDARQRVVAFGRELRSLATLQQQLVGAQQAMEREYDRLRQTETRYRLLFQISSEAVLIADAVSLKVQETNPAVSSLLAESAQDLQGRVLAELFESQGWLAVKALIGVVEAGGRPGEVQVALHKDHREIVVSVSLFRQSGTRLLLLRLRQVGANQRADVTRSSRMLAALDALPDGFVILGEDRSILGANSAFCDMVQQPHENYVVGQPLERWLGRPGVDLNIMLANLREHGLVRNFATIIRSDYGLQQEAVVSAVCAQDMQTPCYGFAIRAVPTRLAVAAPANVVTARSIEQLRELVGRVSLKEIVRESADLIERLCIEAALKVSGDNRASAAQLLGLSRQGFYLKLRRHGLGDLEPEDLD